MFKVQKIKIIFVLSKYTNVNKFFQVMEIGIRDSDGSIHPLLYAEKGELKFQCLTRQIRRE